MKFCGNCGAQLEDSTQYCPYCGSRFEGETRQSGTQPQSAPQYTAQTQYTNPVASPSAAGRKTNGFAVAGFVLGLVSIVLTWCCCFPITPILGIVFSAMALSQIPKTGEDGKGIAVAGLVISILCIVLPLVFFVVGLSADLFDAYGYYDYYDYYDDFGDFFSSI